MGDVEDAAGRDAYINHARVINVDDSEAWGGVPALVAAASAFPSLSSLNTDAKRRLAPYLALVNDERSVEIQPLDLAALRPLSRYFLCEFLVGCLEGLAARRRLPRRMPVSEGYSQIVDCANAWTALPNGLKAQSAWAVDASIGYPVDTVFSTVTGELPTTVASEPLSSCVSDYVNLLLDSGEDLTQMLTDPRLRKLEQFQEAVYQKRTGSTQAADAVRFASADQNSDELASMTMSKNRKNGDKSSPPPSQSTGSLPLSEDALAELDAQHNALYERLQAYIDQRLAGLVPQSASPPPDQHVVQQVSPVRSNGAVIRLSVVLAVLVAMLAIIAYVYVRRTKSTALVVETTSASTTTASAGAASTTDKPATGAEQDPSPPLAANPAVDSYLEQAKTEPSSALKSLLMNRPDIIRPLFDLAFNKSSLPEPAESLMKRFKDGSAVAESDSALRTTMRALLIDYLAWRIHDKQKPPTIRVDGDLTEIDDTVLKELTEHFAEDRKDSVAAGPEAPQLDLSLPPPSGDQQPLQSKIILLALKKGL